MSPYFSLVRSDNLITLLIICYLTFHGHLAESNIYKPPHISTFTPSSISEMMRKQSLFQTQTKGLLLRTWHWQRRQYCSIFCNFIVPPIALILLSVLRRVIVAEEVVALPFQQDPRGAFAPLPFDPASCLRIAFDVGLVEARERCGTDPFVPDYNIPVSVPQQFAQSVGNKNALNDTQNFGLLGKFSLDPFIYPPAVPGDEPGFAETQTPYDGVFLHYYFRGNKTSDAYTQILDVQRSGTIDQQYNAETLQQPSAQDLKSTLYNDWFLGRFLAKYSTAISFQSFSSSDDAVSLSATVFYNESTTSNCTRACPAVSNVARLEKAVFETVSPGKSANAYLRRMPLIDVRLDLGIIPLLISIVIGLFAHFLFPTFLRFLVYERIARLRSMMGVMGLRRTQYWFGTYTSLLIQYCLTVILAIAVGVAVNIPFYADNTPLSYIILFFLWGNILIAMAMLFQPFFSNPESAQTIAWLFVFLVNLVGGPYVGQRLSDNTTSEGTWSAIMILPSFAFMRSVYYAGAINSGGKGVTIGDEQYRDVDLGMCSGSGPFCRSFLFLAVEWIVIMIFAIYFDLVLPSAHGTRRHPLFFVGFKRKVKEVEKEEQDLQKAKGADVLDEEARARNIVANIETEPFDGVVLDMLTKTYPANPPVKALKSLSLVARRNEVVCILAHNGAGKTTAFRTLIGELDVTSGTAYVSGNSIITDMEMVYRNLGVAPQQNILWDVLTVQEHLFFYGRVKNLSGRPLKEAVAKAMESVQLTFARKRRVRALSGGMKRRLSVSISMIGDPDFIILDEPSTGLDILAREKLWESIDKIKENKTIMLTTHSLEEAEALSTRVAIMSQGELMCIGKAEELKLRLGKGHHLSISLPESNMEALHEAITKIAPEATIETQLGGSVDYVLPQSFPVAPVFNLMGEKKEELAIRDWSVNQSSLEDVFLRVTHASRRRSAMDEIDALP